MKKMNTSANAFRSILFALLCVPILAVNPVKASVDTLRYWDKKKTMFVYYDKFNDGSQIAVQAARFPLKAPAILKSLTITLTGGTGSATISVLGHQAGEHIPTLGLNGRDVIGTAKITKAQSGPQTFSLNMAENTRTSQNQIWVMVSGMTAGMYLLSDNTELPLACSAGVAGGDYYYQILVNSQNQLAVGSSGFLIDVIVEYPSLTSPQFFKDVTESIGLPANISNYTIAWGDYDSDGFQDLLVSGHLFHNERGSSFKEVTSTSGITGTPQGNAFADFDNDGDMDILFLLSQRDNTPPSILYVNNGSGVFTAKNLKIPSLKGLSSFSIADINKDKLPDIFIGQLWSEYPASGPDLLPSFLLLNNGSNDFIDNTSSMQNRQSRRSRGSEWVDFDNDGDLDLFITNYLLEHDELWQNDGNGKFTNVIDAKRIEQIVTTNPAYYNHGTGCDWADYDNDGDMDLLLTQFMHPALAPNGFEGTTVYKNTGAPNYTFQTSWNKNTYSDGSGIGYEETHSGGSFGDVNNDGLPDIILPVYYGCRFADFYIQNQNHTFSNATFDWGLEGITSGEDASFADFDNDGRLDLAFANNGLFRLFQNVAPIQNSSVSITLLSASGNRNGIGSRVTVFAGGKKYMQEVTSGRGQRMQKPTTLHFGIGDAQKVDSVLVRWSSKTTQETFINVGKNSLILLEEGKGSTSTGIDKLTSDIPHHSWLDVPVPNPINQSATIRLGIATQGILHVDVVSPNGVNKSHLLSLNNSSAGEYLLTWDCSALESGVYYIRMVTENGVYVQKAIVIH